MKNLNEKIMAGCFAVGVLGFVKAPCCWTNPSKTAAKSIVTCSGSKTGSDKSLEQKNNVTAKNTKNNK